MYIQCMLDCFTLPDLLMGLSLDKLDIEHKDQNQNTALQLACVQVSVHVASITLSLSLSLSLMKPHINASDNDLNVIWS